MEQHMQHKKLKEDIQKLQTQVNEKVNRLEFSDYLLNNLRKSEEITAIMNKSLGIEEIKKDQRLLETNVEDINN